MLLSLLGIAIEVSWWALKTSLSGAYALYNRSSHSEHRADAPLLITDGRTAEQEDVAATLSSVRSELAETRQLLVQLVHEHQQRGAQLPQ